METICDMCLDEIAIWACPDCDASKCQDCDAMFHKAAKRAGHKRRLLVATQNLNRKDAFLEEKSKAPDNSSNMTSSTQCVQTDVNFVPNVKKNIDLSFITQNPFTNSGVKAKQSDIHFGNQMGNAGIKLNEKQTKGFDFNSNVFSGDTTVSFGSKASPHLPAYFDFSNQINPKLSSGDFNGFNPKFTKVPGDFNGSNPMLTKVPGDFNGSNSMLTKVPGGSHDPHQVFSKEPSDIRIANFVQPKRLDSPGTTIGNPRFPNVVHGNDPNVVSHQPNMFFPPFGYNANPPFLGSPGAFGNFQSHVHMNIPTPRSPFGPFPDADTFTNYFQQSPYYANPYYVPTPHEHFKEHGEQKESFGAKSNSEKEFSSESQTFPEKERKEPCEEKGSVNTGVTEVTKSFCVYCGTRVQEDFKFCGSCGKKIERYDNQKVNEPKKSDPQRKKHIETNEKGPVDDRIIDDSKTQKHKILIDEISTSDEKPLECTGLEIEPELRSFDPPISCDQKETNRSRKASLRETRTDSSVSMGSGRKKSERKVSFREEIELSYVADNDDPVLDDDGIFDGLATLTFMKNEIFNGANLNDLEFLLSSDKFCPEDFQFKSCNEIIEDHLAAVNDVFGPMLNNLELVKNEDTKEASEAERRMSLEAVAVDSIKASKFLINSRKYVSKSYFNDEVPGQIFHDAMRQCQGDARKAAWELERGLTDKVTQNRIWNTDENENELQKEEKSTFFDQITAKTMTDVLLEECVKTYNLLPKQEQSHKEKDLLIRRIMAEKSLDYARARVMISMLSSDERTDYTSAFLTAKNLTQGNVIVFKGYKTYFKECVVCCEDVIQDFIIKFPNCSQDCSVCYNCVRDHFSAQICGSGKMVKNILCPGCDQKVLTESSNTLVLLQLKYFLPPDLFGMFERRALDNFLEAEGRFKWCAHSDCNDGIFWENADVLKMQCSKVL